MNRFDSNRPDQVTDVAGTATVFASMRYLGLGTLVGLNYDGASDLNLTYQDGGTGTAGDKYTGLDRFGRIFGTIWIKGSGEVVQGVYGRNRSSGIDWRRDDEASSIIAMDALYEYDGLQQVTAWKRGNLAPGSGPPYTGVNNQKQGEDFTYDQTGNWLGDVSDNPNFTQSRTHDVKNQITSITGPTGVVQPDYDNAGNTTVAPSPGSWSTGYAYKWDAWNRLVEIKQGATVIGSYGYDALTRRTRKTVGGVTRDIYYDRQWRSVEEREGATVKVQHAWSPLDRWTLIRCKRNASGSTLNETLFCLRDYLDPVALANTSGAVVERYSYDAFGTVRIMSAAFGVRNNSSYDWEFLYHGEFRDAESELYNYGYRYLDTQLGRWLSRDPIGESEESNLYVFVGNRGVDQRDAFGLESHLQRQKRLKREAEEKEAAERRKPPVINPYQGPKELFVAKNQVAAARDFFGHVMALEAFRLTLAGNSQSEYGGSICKKCIKCDDGSERFHVMVTGPGTGGARSYSVLFNWTTLPDGSRNYSEICPSGYDAIGKYHSHLFTSAGASTNPSEEDRGRFKQDNKENARLNQNFADNSRFVDNILCGRQFVDGSDPEFVGGVQNAGKPPGVWTINRRLNEPFSDKAPQQPQNNPCA